jgi:hypothetical protein
MPPQFLDDEIGPHLYRFFRVPVNKSRFNRRLLKEHPMKDRSHRWLSHLPFYYGWLIIAIGFVTVAIVVTARTAFSLLLPPLVDEFGWDRS